MPELKTLLFSISHDFHNIIDFLSLHNLKCLSNKVFTKIMSKKYLKEISFHMDDGWDQNIIKAYGENNSVSKIKIIWRNNFHNYKFNDD